MTRSAAPLRRPWPGTGGGTLALCFVLTGCAGDTLSPVSPNAARELPITPYATHEECVALAVGDRLDFVFTTTSPVDFDIRYHDGNAVLMPLVREKTMGFSAIYASSLAQRYCLAWEAGLAGALLDFRIQVHPPPAR